MAKNAMKADWWQVNGWFWILSGVLGVVFSYIGVRTGAVLSGTLGALLNVAVGVALMKRSVVVFWIALVLSGLGFLGELATWVKAAKVGGVGSIDLSTIIILVGFVLALMLWQQIRQEKGKK